MKTPEELIEWLNSQSSIRSAGERRDIISYLAVFEQIRWERDIAIGQLHELGYELGEKIKEKKQG